MKVADEDSMGSLERQRVVDKSAPTSDPTGLPEDGTRPREKRSVSQTAAALRKEIVSRESDAASDLKFLKDLISESTYMSTLIRATMYRPGINAPIQEKEDAFKRLVEATLETASKFVLMSSRSLSLTPDEKKMAVRSCLPWVADVVANKWVMSGDEPKATLDQNDLLKVLRSSKGDIEKLMRKARPSEEEVRSTEDSKSLMLRNAISAALFPIMNMLSLGEDTTDPKVIGELVEAYKDYLIKDSTKFLDRISPEQMKVGQTARLESLGIRLRNISTILSSDIQSFKAREGRNPTKDEIVSDRIPRAKGLVYQIDAFSDSGVGGLKVSQVGLSTAKQFLDATQLEEALEEMVGKDPLDDAVEKHVAKQEGVPPKSQNKGMGM